MAFLGLAARLFHWQVVKSKELSAQARRQHQIGQVLAAPRGNILATDNLWLAGRDRGWLAYAAIPELEENISKVADELAPFFVADGAGDKDEYQNQLLVEASRLKELLGKKKTVWVPLEHKLSEPIKKNIEALQIKGIGFEPEELTSYPEASSAAHLLGFVGKDAEGQDKGYFGLEGYYDLILSGKPGYLARELDARGIPIAIGDIQEIEAVGGLNLLTHIDRAIQILAEKKLKEGLEKYGAKAGTVIIMRPGDGAVLAMSSYPDYDPAKYFEYSDEYFKNPAVSDAFEPGSIFKILVMAAGLDAGVVKPDSECDICSGPLKIDKYTIETWNNQYFPGSTMTEIIVHSDNVGMTFVGQKLGAEKMYGYLTKFGIGSPTGIDLQGEVTPVLRQKKEWSIVDVATASFGQGVAVTPIQMIKAAAVIANGGVSVTPQVVDKLIGEKWQEDIQPVRGGRVISEEAVREITLMMTEAARSGEAKWTHLRGFSVAGKTGTAQIPIAGHYDSEKTIASFVGFAPAEKPKFIMLVTLREPQSSPWASETAAPLWYNIAKDLFIRFGIQPEN